MADELKRMHISFNGPCPMAMTEATKDENDNDISESQRKMLLAVGKSMSVYRKAATALLNGKLSHLRAIAPPHLSEPGNLLVACCPDGVTIRYEAKSNQPNRILYAWVDRSLSETVEQLSQKLIRIIPRNDQGSRDAFVPGNQIRLLKTNPKTQSSRILDSFYIWFEATLERPREKTSPPSKPFRLLSVRNEFELHITGSLDSTPTTKNERPFLVRSKTKLPVGWECIEVFPYSTSVLVMLR